MKFTKLGRTGMSVSRLCLGTMNFGPFTSEADSFRLMDEALDAGINFFDTANVYGRNQKGLTEQIIGRWFAQGGGRREKVVLATKVYGAMPGGGDGPNEAAGLSAYKIRRHVEDSLRRLQTDHIELYQMHHVDRTVSWDELWEVFSALINEGKIVYVGSSNFAGWDIAVAQSEAQRRKIVGLVSEQHKYNLNCRLPELEVLPSAQHFGLGVIPWSPLDGGLLGRNALNPDKSSRSAENQERIQKEKSKLAAFAKFAKQFGEAQDNIALAWLIHNPAVTAPIIGPRTSEQLAESVKSVSLKLKAADLEALDQIFPGPGGDAPKAYAWQATGPQTGKRADRIVTEGMDRMYFKRIVTQGLLACSYLVGDEGSAFVVDPRYDIDIYLQLAAAENLTITHVFETHRHEDQLSGAAFLGQICQARVLRSRYEDPGYTYGEAIGEEAVFHFGERLRLRPLHTPGHTRGHLSYVLEYGGLPYMVFTGDCLFYGGVGRTDFYGREALEQQTQLLYDSLNLRIKALGDSVLIQPGHLAGSACGSDLDPLADATIGFEFARHPELTDAQAFHVAHARMQFKNPAFSIMERRNLRPGGVTAIGTLPVIHDWPDDSAVIDLRDRLAFAGGHLAGSLGIPAPVVASYAGYFVRAGQPIVLVTDGIAPDDVRQAADTLVRMGLEPVLGQAASGSLTEHEKRGRSLVRLDGITVTEYARLAASADDSGAAPDNPAVTLDVRLSGEFDPQKDRLINRLPIPLQDLPYRLDEIPDAVPLYIVCASGERATLAASFLKSANGRDSRVVLGGADGLRARTRMK